MRKIAFLAAAGLLASSAVVWAGAKDQSSNTFVDIDAAGVINNTTGKTKTKSKGCTMQVQMKGVTGLADGDIVICIAEADVVGVGGNSLLFAAEAKAGQIKAKVPMGEAKFLGGVGCGSTEAISYNGNLRCYKDDATYRNDAGGPGTWRAACTAAGMIPGDPSGPTKLKANPTQSIAIGLCQGFAAGVRINPPASVRFAVQGQRTAIIP